jgi:hypothetical protein
MAPKRRYRGPTYSTSPNGALVVFLVFFVLLSLGLGLGMYFAIAGQAEAQAKAKAAQDKEKAADKAKKFTEFVALEARAASGGILKKGQDIDEHNLWNTYRADFLGDPQGFSGNNPTYLQIKEWVAKNSNKGMLGWSATEKKFEKTYVDLINSLEKKVADAEAQRTKDLASVEGWKNKYTDLFTAYDEWQKSKNKEFKDTNDAVLAATQKKTGETEKLIEERNALTKKIEAMKLAHAQDLRGKDKVIYDLESRLGDDQRPAVAPQVDVKQPEPAPPPEGKVPDKGAGPEAKMPDKGAGPEAKMPDKDAPPEPKMAPPPKAPVSSGGQPHALILDISRGKPLWDRAVGRVTGVTAGERTLTISLGSANGVKPGLTFNVFAQGDVQGQAEKGLKASIEVISVLDRHTSLARITSLFDRNGKEIPLYDPNKGAVLRAADNPIQKGDLLFNMFWKTRVALAGKFNIGGFRPATASDELRQLQQLMSVMQDQGIIVDAYLDPVDGNIKGRITRETQFLILGNLAEDVKGQAKEGAPGVSAEDFNKKIGDMIGQAGDNGAFMISSINFAFVTGFRPPPRDPQNAVPIYTPRNPYAGRPDEAAEKKSAPNGGAAQQ